MKKTITLFLLLFSGLMMQAQLPGGSIAPDFTAKDIEGKTWNLYQLLDQGKTVVIDVSATWCAPCWAYHNSGALEDLYAQYGPAGTNEMMVFLVEGDPATTIDDLNGLTTGTQGDWVSSTPYPIIDNADIANLYQITYFPTIYFICQNRIVQEAGQVSTAELYALRNSCAQPAGVNNAAVLNYSDFQGTFCAGKSVTPSVKMQNLGSAPMTSANVELYLNGALTETKSWTGKLNTYQIDDVTFSPAILNETTTITVIVTSVNGTTDDDDTNNQVEVTNTLAPTYDDANRITLELKTDNYPAETYWEILDGEGHLFYKGGNEKVKNSSASSENMYTGPSTVYTHQLTLPADGCWEFRIYDAYGDGICCVEGNGYYKLMDNKGAVFMSGGSFGDLETKPFELTGSSVVHNNGAIIGYSGSKGDFCGTLNYAGNIQLQNLGADPITAVEVEVTQDGNALKTYSLTANIPTGETGELTLDGLTFDQSAKLDISLKSINGAPDEADYKNTWSVELNRNVTKVKDIVVEIQTDNWGYETYWEITSSSGNVIASGGNPLVGPDGGGKRVAAPTDPGAYASNTVITEPVTLPDGVDDCYDLLFVDDYGDGLATGYCIVYNSDNTLESYKVPNSPYTIYKIDAKLNSTGTDELTGVNNLSLSPNPAKEELRVRFQLASAMPLNIQIFNSMGQVVRTIAQQDFAAGSYNMPVQVGDLSSGVYYLQMTDGKQQLTRKFVAMAR